MINHGSIYVHLGQVIMFCMEVVILYIGVVFVSSEHVLGMDRIAIPILVPVYASVLSIIMLLTSPELRRHYKVDDKLHALKQFYSKGYIKLTTACPSF